MPETDPAAAAAAADRSPSEKPEIGRAPMSPWARVFWMFLVLVVAGLAVFGGFVWLAGRTIDSVETGMETAGEAVVGIAEAFRPEVITETFMEFTELKAEGNQGNILEVATAEATETFTRKTNVVWFDREVPLGTTVSEISVPATYRYHIDLNGDWSLNAYDGRVTVIAPELEPSLPVAFDSGRMKKKTRSGWARWDKAENLQELEKGITDKLAERAGHERTIASVRDEARLSVAKFVRNWLIDRDHWSADTYEEIVVVFEDELGTEGKNGSLMERPATLKLPVEADEKAAGGPVSP